MPEIIPDHVPSPRTMLVWDGTRYRAVRGHTDGTVQVRGEDQLFSLKEVLAFRTEANLSADDGKIDTGVVGAGEYWVVTTICCENAARATTAYCYYNMHDAAHVMIGSDYHAIGIAETVCWGGFTVLDPGDFIRVYNIGGLNGDAMVLDVAGYVMTLEV